MLIQPAWPIQQIDFVELVGANEQVDQNELGAAVEVDLQINSQDVSGELLSFLFKAIGATGATGAIQDSAGELLIFTADPGHNAGDDGSGISAAEWANCIGVVPVLAGDWVVEDNGGVLYIKDNPVPFHAEDSLFFVWRHTDATSLNDGAGDDEVLSVAAWWQRHS